MRIDRHDADNGVATLTMDDGARNALDTGVFDAIIAAFDDAGDAAAIVLAGREGALSAGLNVKVMPTLDHDGLVRLLTRFGEAMMRIWTHPTPVVCAATGHALAGGTMLAMACDHAVAADGDFAWGLIETTINFEVPRFGIALAQANVRNDRIEGLLIPGIRVNPVEAVEVGFADELAPPDQVVTRAQAVAAEWAQLPPGAYGGTKLRLRGDIAERVLANLADDIEALVRRVLG